VGVVALTVVSDEMRSMGVEMRPARLILNCQHGRRRNALSALLIARGVDGVHRLGLLPVITKLFNGKKWWNY
jgi:hypothetical protein